MSKASTRVVIIGAGWNGIATAKTYLQVDPSISLTILESESTLGGTWSSSRAYPELLTQQPYGKYEAADLSLDQRDPPQPGNYIPSQRMYTYLQEYAKQWNVADKIRYNSTVESVQRTPDGVGWTVRLQGESTPLICDKLIVATGLSSLPNIPNIPTVDFKPLTFHSKDLGRHYDSLKSPQVQTVTIYGSGKSAYDAATAAVVAGKKVQWVIRSSGEGVPTIIRPEFLGRDASDGAFTPIMAALYPDPLNTGWLYRFMHSGRNQFGYKLNWWFFDWVSRKTLAIWDYDGSEGMRKLKPKVVDHAMYWCTPPPYPVAHTEVLDRVRRGDGVTIHVADITRLEDKSLHLSDGNTLQTDILIYATGYAYHEPIFSVEDSYSLGLPIPIDRLSSLEPDMESHTKRAEEMDKLVLERFPRLADHPSKPRPPTYTQQRLYRSILPLSLLEKQDRSLAFVGNLNGAGTCVIADVSALWCVAWMTGKLDVKREKEDVEWEVDYLNAFMRKRWGDRGREAPISVFEWGSSTNAMLKELDLELPNLSPLKPWLPHVYRGITEKWLLKKRI